MSFSSEIYHIVSKNLISIGCQTIYRNIIVFDNATLNYVKIITALHDIASVGFSFNNSLKYELYFKEVYYIRKIIFDDNLSFTTETKIFQNWQNVYANYIMKLIIVNNTFIFANTNIENFYF